MKIVQPTRVRDSNLEFYRVFLMGTICLFHAVGVNWCGDGCVSKQLSGVFQFAVDGFVLLSAYFGIRFRPSKVISLCAIGIYSSVVAAAVGRFLLGWHSVDECLFVEAYRIYCSYWFLHAYVVLMMTAPLVDKCLSTCTVGDAMKLALPILFLIFGWSFASEIRLGGFCWPRDLGFGNMTWLTLFGVYVFGRLVRISHIDDQVKTRHLLLAILVLLPISYFVPCVNNSLLCLLHAAVLFSISKRMKIPAMVARICCLFAGSMFSVYLIHSNAIGWKVISDLRVRLMALDFPKIATWVIVATVLFMVGILLDSPRRIVSSLFVVPIQSVCKAMDLVYEKVVESLLKGVG